MLVEERAAIREYKAGLSRAEADGWRASKRRRLHYDARSGMIAPSPGAERMRRSRERRRQGDVIVKLEVGPNMTTDLVALGWLPAPDRVDKDALALALVGLIDRVLTMRVTPSTMESETVSFTPLHVTEGPIAIGS